MYYIFNLITSETSKKGWKTYNGAWRNLTKDSIITTKEGIEWMLRHPDWQAERYPQTSKPEHSN